MPPVPAVPVTASLRDFAGLVASLNLRHFNADELAVNTQNSSTNTPPPRQFWGNAVATAIVLDELREQLRRIIFVTNAYRSPIHNLANGVCTGQHMLFRGIDFMVEGGNVRFAFKTLMRWSGRKFIRAPQVLQQSKSGDRQATRQFQRAVRSVDH